MKNQVSPAVIGIVALVLVAFLGFLGYKFLSPTTSAASRNATPAPPPANAMSTGDAYRQHYGAGNSMSSQGGRGSSSGSPYGGSQPSGYGQYRPGGSPR